MQHYKTKQNIVNSKTKQKSKTILGVIGNLVLDFILYFVTAYSIFMKKYLSNMNTRLNTKYTTHHLNKKVKKNLWQTITKFSKLLQWKMYI